MQDKVSVVQKAEKPTLSWLYGVLAGRSAERPQGEGLCRSPRYHHFYLGKFVFILDVLILLLSV